MTITGQNVELHQGDDRVIIITVYDEDNNILSLTGYDAVFVVYEQTMENLVITKSTMVGGISISNPTSGEIEITLSSEDTEGLTAKTYGLQCEVQDSFGNCSTVTTGLFKVLKSFTHGLF